MPKTITASLSDSEMQDTPFGSFRPGFYPLKSDTVVPAIVWLSEHATCPEPDIHFIFVKACCQLREWADALCVSEKDKVTLNEIMENIMAQSEERDNSSEKIHRLWCDQLTALGYLPLQKVSTNIKLDAVH